MATSCALVVDENGITSCPLYFRLMSSLVSAADCLSPWPGVSAGALTEGSNGRWAGEIKVQAI